MLFKDDIHLSNNHEQLCIYFGNKVKLSGNSYWNNVLLGFFCLFYIKDKNPHGCKKYTWMSKQNLSLNHWSQNLEILLVIINWWIYDVTEHFYSERYYLEWISIIIESTLVLSIKTIDKRLCHIITSISNTQVTKV